MLKVVLSLYLLRVTLDVSYFIYIAPVWGYMGYSIEIDSTKVLFTYFLIPLIGTVTPKKGIKSSTDLTLVLLVAFACLPFQTYTAFAGGTYTQSVLPVVSVIIISLSKIIKKVKIPNIKWGKVVLYTFFLFAVILYIGNLLIRGGMQNFNLDLTEVYNVRSAQKQILHSGIIQYFGNWTTKIVLPFIILMLFAQKRYLFASLFVLMAVFIFGMSNHKTTVLFPLLAISLYTLLKLGQNTHQILIKFAAIISLLIGLALVFDEQYMASYLVRRAIYVAAQNFNLYEAFFSQNGYLTWSNSIFSSFVHYPYHTSPAELIGEVTGEFNYANSGMIAAGYMHAGYIGVIFYSIILAVYLRLLDSLISENDSVFLNAIIAAPILHVILNVDLLTAFSLHGLALIPLLFVFLRGYEQAENPIEKLHSRD